MSAVRFIELSPFVVVKCVQRSIEERKRNMQDNILLIDTDTPMTENTTPCMMVHGESALCNLRDALIEMYPVNL